MSAVASTGPSYIYIYMPISVYIITVLNTPFCSKSWSVLADSVARQTALTCRRSPEILHTENPTSPLMRIRSDASPRLPGSSWICFFVLRLDSHPDFRSKCLELRWRDRPKQGHYVGCFPYMDPLGFLMAAGFSSVELSTFCIPET